MMHRYAVALIALAVLFRPSIAAAIWGNAFTGTPICNAASNQVNAVSIPDGMGGAIIAWGDTRNGNSDIFAQRVNAWGEVQWTANGVAVRVAASQQTNPAIVSDGAGGAIVFWEHLANNGSTDIQAQRISASGTQQWLNPTTVCQAQFDQSSPRAVADGFGGAIVVWQDNRPGSTSVADVYAQRVNMSGGVVWASDGSAVCAAADKQTNAVIVGDGSSGAIIAWSDHRDGVTYSVWAQRMNAGGVAQWPINGIPIGSDMGGENRPAIASDGAGGAIIAWHSDTDGDNDIYAQRIGPSGGEQWTTGGIGVCTAADNQSYPQITPDAIGGAIVTWQDLRNTVTFVDEDVYAQRLNSSGAAQWAANGVVVCAESGQSVQPQIISDGAGGAVVVWTDTRFMDYNLFAQRVNSAGTPLWFPGGVTVINAASGQTGPAPVTDGAYGVIVAWNDTRSGAFDVYANRITGGGFIPTAVHDTPTAAKTVLGQNHPNPFNPSTTIEYKVATRGAVEIEIFNAKGERVASLDQGVRDPGSYRASWNAPSTVSSGVYFYRLAGVPSTESRKMVLVK